MHRKGYTSILHRTRENQSTLSRKKRKTQHFCEHVGCQQHPPHMHTRDAAASAAHCPHSPTYPIDERPHRPKTPFVVQIGQGFFEYLRNAKTTTLCRSKRSRQSGEHQPPLRQPYVQKAEIHLLRRYSSMADIARQQGLPVYAGGDGYPTPGSYVLLHTYKNRQGTQTQARREHRVKRATTPPPTTPHSPRQGRPEHVLSRSPEPQRRQCPAQ